MPEVKKPATAVERVVEGLEHTLGTVRDIQAKVDHIYPNPRDQGLDRAERPDEIGLAQAIVLLDDLQEGLGDLYKHLDLIV